MSQADHTSRSRESRFGLLRGIEVDLLARLLIRRSSAPGRVRLRLAGRVERLLRLGRIDEHLRVPVDEGVELDVWLLRGRGPSAPRGTVLQIHGLWDSKARFLAVGDQGLLIPSDAGDYGGRQRRPGNHENLTEAATQEVFGGQIGGLLVVRFHEIHVQTRHATIDQDHRVS